MAYTFLCLGPNRQAAVIDIQPLAHDAIQAHAANLLREHASAASIEIWRDEMFVALVDRGA